MLTGRGRFCAASTSLSMPSFLAGKSQSASQDLPLPSPLSFRLLLPSAQVMWPSTCSFSSVRTCSTASVSASCVSPGTPARTRHDSAAECGSGQKGPSLRYTSIGTKTFCVSSLVPSWCCCAKAALSLTRGRPFTLAMACRMLRVSMQRRQIWRRFLSLRE